MYQSKRELRNDIKMAEKYIEELQEQRAKVRSELSRRDTSDIRQKMLDDAERQSLEARLDMLVRALSGLGVQALSPNFYGRDHYVLHPDLSAQVAAVAKRIKPVKVKPPEPTHLVSLVLRSGEAIEYKALNEGQYTDEWVTLHFPKGASAQFARSEIVSIEVFPL